MVTVCAQDLRSRSALTVCAQDLRSQSVLMIYGHGLRSLLVLSVCTHDLRSRSAVTIYGHSLRSDLRSQSALTIYEFTTHDTICAHDWHSQSTLRFSSHYIFICSRFTSHNLRSRSRSAIIIWSGAHLLCWGSALTITSYIVTTYTN